MCGTAAADAGEWQKNGNQCVACGNDTYRDECTRCRGECTASGGGGDHPCVSVNVYHSTGRIAFPEEVPDATKREDARKPDPKQRPPKPVPPTPPLWSWLGENIAGIWRRYRGGLAMYAVFEGRSSRKDFWSFIVIQTLGISMSDAIGAAGLVVLITAIPTLAVAVRRLHDVGVTGHWLWLLVAAQWWGVLALVPLAMFLWPGRMGRNQYGDAPS